MSIELNMDGLVGPTHNYAGLSFGNIASDVNRGRVSNPRSAALQGLSKMRTLVELGLPQAILPPHERPYIPVLRQLGFTGKDETLVENAWRTHPMLLAKMSSASAMWTANAATVTPAVDSRDGKTHFTPANLVAMAHRAIEPQTTKRLLGTVFADEEYFIVHDSLPAGDLFGDEGAANHNRLCVDHQKPGLEIFIHGRQALLPYRQSTSFPGRQTLEASQAVARLHQLNEAQVIHHRQSPDAIDGGAFHNDVVCVSNENVFLFHETAFSDLNSLKDEIIRKAEPLGFAPIFVMANAEAFSLQDAVASYFFNSQLISLPDGGMALILPTDAEENSAAAQFASQCVEGDNPITAAHFLDLRQSMRNGGGPACLRLRVPLSKPEMDAMHQPVLMTYERLSTLESWVQKHYREDLRPDDLGDPMLVRETQSALDELTQILELGSFYHFQMDAAASRPNWG